MAQAPRAPFLTGANGASPTRVVLIVANGASPTRAQTRSASASERGLTKRSSRPPRGCSLRQSLPAKSITARPEVGSPLVEPLPGLDVAGGDQPSSGVLQPIELSLGPAVFDRQILALDITGLLQALAKAPQAPRRPVRRLGIEMADHWHCRLLRTRHERPRCCRASEQRDELAAVH